MKSMAFPPQAYAKSSPQGFSAKPMTRDVGRTAFFEAADFRFLPKLAPDEIG